MTTTAEAIFWQRLDVPGSEYCIQSQESDGWRCDGTVLVVLDGQPMQVRYRVACDATWQTRAVDITLTEGTRERALQITVDESARWWIDGAERTDLRGCREVDLEVTPATNTLPIRRLGLPIGASETITAAWVRFPSLTILSTAQQYTRLDAHRYRYESGTYQTEIDVDSSGLVTHYPDGWHRILSGADSSVV